MRNGPKGISLFKPFFLKSIKPDPTKAPRKKAKNSPARIFGKPSKNPNRIASLTSPKPIHRPPEIKKIKRKNPDATIAAKTEFKIRDGELKIR